MRTFILIFIALVVKTVSAQTIPTENAELKGWTKETKIMRADFKGKPTANLNRLHKEHGLQASAQITLRSVLDVPKRKKDQGTHLEKVYIAPFFMKSASVSFTNDEKELDKQRLYFDMGEAFARKMRRYIQHLQDSTKSYGTLWTLYASIKNYYCEEFGQMFNDYTAEVFGEKKEGAYEEWRAFIDKALLDLEAYATKPEDCIRLLGGKPVDPMYEESKTIVGALNGCH